MTVGRDGETFCSCNPIFSMSPVPHLCDPPLDPEVGSPDTLFLKIPEIENQWSRWGLPVVTCRVKYTTYKTVCSLCEPFLLSLTNFGLIPERHGDNHVRSIWCHLWSLPRPVVSAHVFLECNNWYAVFKWLATNRLRKIGWCSACPAGPSTCFGFKPANTKQCKQAKIENLGVNDN